MAKIITHVTIKCKDRKEYRRVGVHLRSCKKHLDGCGEKHSFKYVAKPLLLSYSGAFEQIDFEQWDDQFPLIEAENGR